MWHTIIVISSKQVASNGQRHDPSYPTDVSARSAPFCHPSHFLRMVSWLSCFKVDILFEKDFNLWWFFEFEIPGHACFWSWTNTLNITNSKLFLWKIPMPCQKKTREFLNWRPDTIWLNSPDCLCLWRFAQTKFTKIRGPANNLYICKEMCFCSPIWTVIIIVFHRTDMNYKMWTSHYLIYVHHA